jgi:hypothetical protein
VILPTLVLLCVLGVARYVTQRRVSEYPEMVARERMCKALSR